MGQGEAPDGQAVTIGLGLVSGDEFVIGTLDTFGSDPKELEAAIQKDCRRRAVGLISMEPRGRYFLLPLAIPITVVIAGAGHVLAEQIYSDSLKLSVRQCLPTPWN